MKQQVVALTLPLGPVPSRTDVRHGRGGTDETPAFADEITLGRDEVFDVVARCDEVAGHAAAIGDLGIAFSVDSIRRFLLGRLMGEPGGLDDGPGDA